MATSLHPGAGLKVPLPRCLPQELYVSNAADKRTCLEALVTRDKLKEIGGEARWLSSERLYADGLTKDPATQLLADRLRTHQHKIIADDTYQASRKKKASERVQSANQFARTSLRGLRPLHLLSPPQLFRLGPRASPRTSPRPLFCTRCSPRTTPMPGPTSS